VRAKVERMGLLGSIPSTHFHPTVNDAVRDFRQATGEDWTASGA